MNLSNTLENYREQHRVLAVIDLDQWYDQKYYNRESWLESRLRSVWRSEYRDDERIIFTLSQGDETHNGKPRIITTLARLLNRVDISNFFCVLLTNDRDTDHVRAMNEASTDLVPVRVDYFDDPPNPGIRPGRLDSEVSIKRKNAYNSREPLNVSLDSLPLAQQDLLTKSKVFCILPWIHLHAYPTGEAWPCCHVDMRAGSVGNCRKNTLEEIYNGDRMRQLRKNMLAGDPDPLCVKCYEQDEIGFFSGRQSANKHHGHHINRIQDTDPDGNHTQFQMTYWDIRFSNLCNLRCRSCGHIFSSQWYQDQARLAGPAWRIENKPLNYAGRFETDMIEQLLPHIEHVEQIYFAGGEPLLMEEHYLILEELERRGRFDVRLIYNTNFTEVKLKDRSVFDYWKKFHSVSIGASLDAMGPQAEYIRKGTVWSQVERNRRAMLEICPEVDFYISPTLSIMNAWHLPDFHRSWVEQGLIRAQDLNVNILQDPVHYRIDIAPADYKHRLRDRYLEHLEWLRPQDHLSRATVGFESAIDFLMATDNSHLINRFWSHTDKLDDMRKEKILDVLPELRALA